MQGWVKLHRQFKEWEWYTDDKCFRLFIHLLLSCNHKTANWRGETIEKGQMITSLGTLANDTGMTLQTLRTTLTKLEKTQEINRQSTSKLTRITICNYERYQEDQQATNTETNKPVTNDQQTTNKQLTTNKNVKNKKNDDNEEKDKHTERDSQFSLFWEAYGKKGNRKTAMLRFRKLTNKQVEEVQVNLPAYLYKTNENLQYRKNAEVYLNPEKEHWNDYVFIEQPTDELTF